MNHGNFQQVYYENGKRLDSGVLNKNCIEAIKSKDMKLLTLGAIEEGNNVANSYNVASLSKMNLKCLRIYNRGLSEPEIMKNYNKTTSYHEMMEAQKNN